MRIKNKTRQDRRDFWAIYECEHCGHETGEESGYDDTYFHQHVIPDMKCPNCGEAAAASTPKTMPDVPAHVTI